MNEYLLALNLFLNPPKLSVVQVTQVTEVVTEPVVIPEPEPTQETSKPIQPHITPAPIVEAKPSATHHRSDGYDNMCYRLDNGYTTVIISNYEGNDRIFPYLGEIDPSTNTPATAEGSQKWCEANDPIETGNAS